MGSTSDDQMTLAKALEIIQNNEAGQHPAAVNTVLERAAGEIWHRILAQPTTYVMTKDEFTIFNRYRARFSDHHLAEQAVARFWNNFRGDPSGLNGGRRS